MNHSYFSPLTALPSKENLLDGGKETEVLQAIQVTPDYRVLFLGQNNAAKQSFAAHIATELHREAYRVDVPAIVSKYIGETEKNLKTLFAGAQDKSWILFFDEADALFGKRTNVHDAHDRYANQAMGYLLQRIDDYKGPLIVSANMKHNIDSGFTRRFHLVLHF